MQRRRGIGGLAFLALALAGLALLAVLQERGQGSPGPRGEDSAAGAAAARADGGAPDSGPGEATASASGRRSRVDEPAAPVAAPDMLRGIVLAPGGQPAPGAEVRALWGPAAGFGVLDRAFRRQATVLARSGTGPDGTFALRLPPGRPCLLEVEAAGLPVRRVGGCQAGSFVTVQLLPGATLRGAVLRAADRAPVAGAKVRGWRRAESRLQATGDLCQGVTDAGGRFAFSGIEPGPLTIDVLPEREASPRWIELDLAPGEEREIEVLVEDGIALRGLVRDAATGAPVAGATVREGWSGGRSVRTGADGTFVLPGFSHLRIEVEAPGYAAAERWLRRQATESVAQPVEVELVRGRAARGLVQGPGGEPLAGVYVAAAASDRGGEHQSQRTDWVAASTGETGAFELAHLRPELRHTLFVRKAGFGTLVYEFPEAEAELPVVDFGVLRLPPAASLQGSLRDEHGEPVAGQEVSLWGANADRFGDRGGDPFAYRSIDHYVAEREARTDGEGRFAFADLAGGTYRLRVDLGGHGRYQTMDVDLAPGERRAVQFVVRRRLAIGGTVRAGDGGPLPTVYVSVDPQDGVATSADVEVAGGRFLAEGLDPGVYTLTVYPYADGADRAKGREFAWQKIKNVPAGTRDVEIVLVRAGRIAGRLLDAGGAPLAGGTVAALDAEGEVFQLASTGADGTFTLTVPVGVPFALAGRRRRPDGAEADPPWTAHLPEARAGDPPVTLRLRR